MTDKTEAICIRIAPFSRTSHVVLWLTPTRGVLRTVAKGALRPKSVFLGQYDLFQTCELIYYTKSSGDLHILKECTPNVLRNRFRDNWRAAAMASYVCDLVAHADTGPGHVSDTFPLLTSALDVLAVPTGSPSLLFWFELRVLHLMGVAPSLTQCAACRQPLGWQSPYTFSSPRGGLLCPACPVRTQDDATPITPDLVAMLRHWQRVDTAEVAVRTRCTRKQLLAVSQLLGTFIGFHLDIRLACRQAAIEMAMLAEPALWVAKTGSDVWAAKNRSTQ